jgi:hypothetical protein
VKQIDRPKLTENVARESLMQCRDRTIELIPPVALAAMIDEYAIFGPKLGDRLPSFLAVALSEHLVEIALNEGLYCIRHSTPPVLATMRKRAECGAQFLGEYGGLLKGREMSAVGGLVPIKESRIDPLAPQSRR